MDYLYKYFGGKNLYSKEEWEKLTTDTYEVIETDLELGTQKVIQTGRSYEGAVNTLMCYGIRDFDFAIQMKNERTGKLLAEKTFADGVDGGKISVKEDCL